MNIAERSIKNSTITWVVTGILLVVGMIAFNNLSRLEDPEFTIKEAMIITPYPGASAREVEIEVSDLVERATQEMGQLFYVESHSYRDKSIVKVRIKDQYDKDGLPQVWDELRRKVNDIQHQLPPGAGPSLVNDDFGDVFGVYIALTGDGYTQKDLYEFAKFLRRELLLVQDVKKITFYGQPKEVIYVEMQRDKMTALGISPQDIYSALGAKNTAEQAGYMTVGNRRLAVSPTGEFHSEQQFAGLVINARNLQNQQVVLGDVATITRGLQDPPNNLLRFDGEPAIGLAISTTSGGNVVTMGEGLYQKVEELKPQIPLGIQLNVVSMQSDSVVEAINNFLISLIEAVVIVVVVLLFFMGLRSGLIIGTVLAVTITGTFIFMSILGITLERISLGALIIALGMLVDNAIVVTDGMRVRMEQGEDALSAARKVVSQTAMPLLGATAVAIAAFAAIGTSQDATGEYTRSLFTVILISLTMSWVTAVTTTPLLCKTFLKSGQLGSQGAPYQGVFYQRYRQFLTLAIQHRWVAIGITVALFAASLIGFGYVKQSFFPDSTRPQFMVDLWLPEGTHIHETERRLAPFEEKLKGYSNVTKVTTQVGGSSPRFLLTYQPEQPNSNFARLLVDVDDYRIINQFSQQVQNDLEFIDPDVNVNVRLFVLGPATGGKVQLRLSGPDHQELRRLGNEVLNVLRQHPNVKGIRNEWGEQVQVIKPVMSDVLASQLGIGRPEIAQATAHTVEGVRAGVYRERDELIPIVARAPEHERRNLDNLDQLPIWSPTAQRMIPLGQVVSHFDVDFENPHIWRQDRVSMLRIHFDQREGLSSELLADLKADVEKAINVDVAGYLKLAADADIDHQSSTIPIKYRDRLPIAGKPGYYAAWGGENEDSDKGSTAIMGSIPVFFGLMVFIVICLFNSLRKTAVIWLVVPLAIVGVTAGLLLFNQPFGFMALLGFMSLAGMLIKNAIVLVDQIGEELSTGKNGVEAVIESGVSRLIPVAMAAATTILGMIPLLGDAFFIAMAVTIMFGLGFATVLTLVVVPVLYATIFRFR
ncbi:efflux RND transporter permease subunit [Simiduia agarivorans]|uniref:Acriflavin resistance protein n=1 Tax=Simiduia agarivorans (strain DSM 21679 / JCM 13881 / BCRC 17597 / SA1) TaxID=1117647 RepID=K4KIJ0_SIMAS|nr:efflux RND transporter permease subunit [Simiduia agarivorans]AFU98841.1 acriflavin resistance protein [Simiduia agarivorans SA1 = DSM 21679]